MEPQPDPSIKPQRIRGRPFPVGNNVNPRGRASVTDLVRAETVILVDDFRKAHGRAPTRGEYSRIENAADFRVYSKRRLPAEDKNKLARTAELILRKLGIDKPVQSRDPASTSIPHPTRARE